MQRRAMGWILFVLTWGCGTTAPVTPHGVDSPSPSPTQESVSYPGEEWPTADPLDHGLDPNVLQSAADYSESIGGLCLLVIRDGELVFEHYANGATQDSTPGTWSIAKSFSSSLIGIAVGRGEIERVDMPVADLVEPWQGTEKASITIEDVLGMRAGLHYNLLTDNSWTVLESDHTQAALDNSIDAPPATEWHYNNHSVQVLDAVLEAATGRDPEAYAIEHLWRPLGMRVDAAPDQRVHWNRDDSGNTTMYMNVHARCRDLARFGYLYLHDGRWEDEQIVPADYVKSSLTPQPLNPPYGWLWWLNGQGPGIDSTDKPIDGWMFDFAPADLFGAQGLGQNFIDVIPSTQTIYVHARPAPIEPLSNFVDDPVGTLDALLNDGQNREHAELLQMLLEADLETP